MKFFSILITLLALVAVGVLYHQNVQKDVHINVLEQEIAVLQKNITQLESTMNSEFVVVDDNDTTPTEDATEIMTVSYSVITEGGYPDGFTFAQAQVPQSSAVLTASYEALFQSENTFELADGTSVSSMIGQSALNFDSVTIDEGVAQVYLSGNYQLAHMGNYLFREQVNRTGFQFATVNTVHVFVNNQTFDWCDYDDADPSEGLCAEGPRLWIDTE